MSASSPALSTSPDPILTWKIDGPPEMVDGIVMNVMTSCSLRPANRAKKPPIAWMPSCELPANRMTASEILETFEVPAGAAVRIDAESLIKRFLRLSYEKYILRPAATLLPDGMQ